MKDHTPVLLKEVLYFLDVRAGRKYIDATVGGSGHTEAILKLGGEVLGLDVSEQALRLAKERLRQACSDLYQSIQIQPSVSKAQKSKPNRAITLKVKLVKSNFSHIGEIAPKEGFKRVDGILIDLGIASFQLSDPTFGLSFNVDSPLDMRLDQELGVSAADLVNSLPEKELYELFYEIGQEQHAREIARAIVRSRSFKLFETTRELAWLVEEVYGRRKKSAKIHPATKVFMALRIAVNLEFENLKQALPEALSLLKPGGRLAVISFHSGEDRIVKQFFKEQEKLGTVKILTKKPVTPSETEISENPRARSSKLRVVEKNNEKQIKNTRTKN